ncbi:MAG: glutamine amidotransferase [Planctomycetota bacterium]
MPDRIAINPILNSTTLVILIGVGLFALLLLQPRFSGATAARRRWLLALRAGVILLLLFGMLRPSLISTEKQEITSTVAVVLDTSRSMQVDDVNGKTRFEAMREAAGRCLELEQASDGKLQFRFYAFDDDTLPLQPADGEILSQVEPEGRETDIGSALQHVVQAHQSERLGAVVLMSDGAVRTYKPVVDLRRIASELQRQGTALYPITFGRSRDQTESRDVAIANLPDQFDVFSKNRIPIKATVQISGYVGRTIPISMTVTDEEGNSETYGPIERVAREDGEVLDVEFQLVAGEPGQYKLEISAPAQVNEQVTENNRMSAYMNVWEGGLRVLFISGNIGWQEQKFIRRSLAASEDIDVEFHWIDRRNRDRWPTMIGPTLDDANYDVVLIEDVPAAALGNAQCELLASQVREGRGLMMLGGKFSFGAGDYAKTALRNVLPIVMTPFERQDLNRPRREDVHLEGPIDLVPRRPHFVTRLSDTQTTRRWQTLPPLQGANRFSGLAPTGRVLLESTDGDSILVAGEYGLGRVLAFAGDSTYRWYRAGQQEAHKRFWRQAILWLAKKDDSSEQQITIRMDQRRFAAGNEPTFEIQVDDASAQEDGNQTTTAIQTYLVAPDGGRTTLATVAKPDGSFTGSTGVVTAPGEFQIEAQYLVDGAVVSTASLPFQVLDEDIEMSDPAANPSQMAMLAALTEQNGGRAAAAENLGAVVREIRQRAEGATTDIESKWQLTDTAGDAWTLFLMMVALLSVDWYFRKKWHMV